MPWCPESLVRAPRPLAAWDTRIPAVGEPSQRVPAPAAPTSDQIGASSVSEGVAH